MTSKHAKLGDRGKRSRSEEAYAELKQRILNNEYPPGHQTLEQEITLELGMSRTPIREALVRLAHEGLIELIPRHGFRVTPIALDDMIEIYDLLTALEAMAVELLTKRHLSQAELAPLVKATEAMKTSLIKDDLNAWAAADEHYHALLLSLCGNQRLAQMATTVRDQSHRVRMVTLTLRDRPDQSTQEHEEVLNAILSGDFRLAQRLHYDHRQRVSKELVKILAKRPIQPL